MNGENKSKEECLQGKIARAAWQWGFSCEFLLVKDIIELKVPELMKELNFGLFLKMYEKDFDETFAILLNKLKSLGIYHAFYPWPVLPMEDGYYPNIKTVEKFNAMIERILAWYKVNQFPTPPFILVDIEPDADQSKFKKSEELRAKRALIEIDASGKIIPVDPDRSNAELSVEMKKQGKKGDNGIIATVGKIIDQIDEMDETRFNKASKKFQELVDLMHHHGTNALCVALPATFSDIKDGKNYLQDFLTTPIHSVSWDMINYMIFAEPLHNILEHEDYVHLVYTYCKDFSAYHGNKASICFGITGFGKRFNQIDPELYIKEFNASLAAGVKLLGIFCLENILALGEEKFRSFCEKLNGADGTFTPDQERLDFAWKIRRLWEAVDDAIAPLLIQLVKSGRAIQLIQKITSGKL